MRVIPLSLRNRKRKKLHIYQITLRDRPISSISKMQWKFFFNDYHHDYSYYIHIMVDVISQLWWMFYSFSIIFSLLMRLYRRIPSATGRFFFQWGRDCLDPMRPMRCVLHIWNEEDENKKDRDNKSKRDKKKGRKR